MLSDNDLISLVVSEPSWEDVIVKIVAEEGMDPWSVDIIRLADAFTIYVSKMKENDLRVPARFILIAAIFVRMKSDILAHKKERTTKENEQKENPLLELLAQIPPLQPPVKRSPERSVTVNELIYALKKAFDVKERRERKKRRTRSAVERAMPESKDDITKRIENLLDQINKAIEDIEGSVEFSRLVQKWERDNIIKTLIPMLHLTQSGRITHNQADLFEEIYVEVRNPNGAKGENKNDSDIVPASESAPEKLKSQEIFQERAKEKIDKIPSEENTVVNINEV